MLFEPLPHLRALLFDGPDASSFLQSQLTSDLRALRIGACQLTSWCNAQGRMISFGVLAQESELRFVWVVPAGEAAQLLTRLTMFKFRAKLTIKLDTREVAQVCDTPGAGRFASVTPADGEGNWRLPDGRCLRLFAPSLETDPQPTEFCSSHAWHLADVRAKLPWSAGGERFVAQVLGLHTLGALSLSKGCYPGQEVIARIHYKGGVKRTLVHLVTQATEAFECPLKMLGIDGTEAGEILQAVSSGKLGTQLLCVVASDAKLPLLAAVNHRNITLSLAC